VFSRVGRGLTSYNKDSIRIELARIEVVYPGFQKVNKGGTNEILRRVSRKNKMWRTEPIKGHERGGKI